MAERLPNADGAVVDPKKLRDYLLWLSALLAAKLAVAAFLLHRGFTHISDDDYARTVIAEQFAHAPRLDPSGTSWLPLPFWVEGVSMMIAGRSLAVARALAVFLGAASVAAPYLAMRYVGVSRRATVLAVAGAMVLPWNAWLGAATVPEGWTGALVAAAAIAMAKGPAVPPWAAAALLVASLSRYEAWPACAVMAAMCVWRANRGDSVRHATACALLALAGPVAWMAWNAHAHGSSVHFLTRVSTFRHAMGAANATLGEKLFDYPGALVGEAPEAFVLGLVGAGGMAASAAVRGRWKWAGVVAMAIAAFLVVGDLRDGAPTHHPARALAALWWILVGMGVDSVDTLVRRAAGKRARLVGLAGGGLAAIAWCATLPSRWDTAPGRSASEERDAQIARGLGLRARGVAHVFIVPCSFEHFALLAAWGEPERAQVAPRTGEAPTKECPTVVER